MAKVFRTLRNHWKKSTFAVVVGYFGYQYAAERRRQFLMMRVLCEEAGRYGQMPLPLGAHNKHVTLLLNPAASGRKGKDKFEKYAEPLLHMSGFLVTVVKTERVNEAKDLTSVVDKTNIIAVAGGDGTLSEVVTGLLRRDDADDACRRYPIAIIPVGSENLFANAMPLKSEAQPDRIAEAAMAVVNHRIVPKDVIKIQATEPETVVNEETGEETVVTLKPVYSMSGMRLGMVREAQKRKSDMMSIWPENFTTFWSYLWVSPTVFKAEIRYTPPCQGCLRCYVDEPSPQEQRSFFGRITSALSPRQPVQNPKPTTENEECGVWKTVEVETPEFNIKPASDGALVMEIGQAYDGRTNFLRKGFSILNKTEDQLLQPERILFNDAQIRPKEAPEFCSIDGEEFEVKPIDIQLLKRKVLFFTPK